MSASPFQTTIKYKLRPKEVKSVRLNLKASNSFQTAPKKKQMKNDAPVEAVWVPIFKHPLSSVTGRVVAVTKSKLIPGVCMMDGLEDLLKENVKGILPHLEDAAVDELVHFLILKGVKKERDLRRMSVAVLEGHLHDLVDASDLHEEWQRAYGAPTTVTVPATTSNAPSQSIAGPSGNKPLVSVENLRGRVHQNEQKMPVFQRDSPYIPASVRSAMDQKIRASSKGRSEMVHRIVDHCRETVPGLTRIMFNSVALQLVTMYPETFKDSIVVSDHGSDSLAKQLKDKFDNEKRPKILTQSEKAAPAVKEAYGCLQWNPSLPEGDSAESQEVKRATLKDMHLLTKKEWDWKLIRKHMVDTFYLQRKDLNKPLPDSRSGKKRKRQSLEEENAVDDPSNQVTVLEIRGRWPFLFTPRGLNYHFKLLTGVDFRDVLDEFVKEEGSLMIEFLASKGEGLAKIKRKMVRAEKNGQTLVKFPTVLKMLVTQLKDDQSRLIQFVESTTTFEEVLAVANFPPGEGTPIIIAAGTTVYDSKKFYLCIDENPVATLTTLQDAFGMLFSSYFVLGLEYAEALSALLTYTQRAIAGIAGKGGKCRTAALTRRSNERALGLHNKFQEYKQLIDEEEN